MSSVKWWPFCSYISVLKWFLISSICLLFGTYTWTSAVHDDDIKCKHFPCYCPFVRGIHRSPVDSPHKDQWRGALILSLICAWTNSWANNRNADDLRPHSAHYGVTLMLIVKISKLFWHLHKMKVSFKMHFSVRLYIIVAKGMTLPILQMVTSEFETSGNDHCSILLTA